MDPPIRFVALDDVKPVFVFRDGIEFFLFDLDGAEFQRIFAKYLPSGSNTSFLYIGSLGFCTTVTPFSVVIVPFHADLKFFIIIHIIIPKLKDTYIINTWFEEIKFPSFLRS